MRSEGRVARVTEIIAGSPKSFEDAIQVGFKRASKTLRGITGLRVTEQRAASKTERLLNSASHWKLFLSWKADKDVSSEWHSAWG